MEEKKIVPKNQASLEKQKVIEQSYFKIFKKINHKINNLNLEHASIQRNIKTLFSAIHDFNFILNNMKSSQQPEIEVKSLCQKIDTSMIASLLKKKENRAKNRLSNLKKEKASLKDKSVMLATKKDELKNRMEIAQESFSEKKKELKKIEPIDENEISEKEYNSNISQEYEEEEEEDTKELTNYLNDLIIQNQTRREQLTKKAQMLNDQKEQIIIIQQQLKEEQIEEEKQTSEKQIQIRKMHQQALNRQKNLDKENQHIDELIEVNQKRRKEIEETYEVKLQKINQYTDEISSIDQMTVEIHQITNKILNLREEISYLQGNKRKNDRQTKTISNNIDFLKNIKKELVDRKTIVEDKKKKIEERENLLISRKQKLKNLLDSLEAQEKIVVEKNLEVENIENQISELESKLETFNEEIKKQSAEIENLTLEISSRRADSRMKHLQSIMDAKTDSSNTNNHSSSRKSHNDASHEQFLSDFNDSSTLSQ